MSTFQGFNVIGIDPNQYPVFTDDNDMRHDLFYLTLKSIGADADSENRRLWDYCFRHEIKRWDNPEQEHALPELKFAFYVSLGAVIIASGEPLRTLESCLFDIERLVKAVNERFIREANEVLRFREDIQRINDSFRNRVINM